MIWLRWLLTWRRGDLAAYRSLSPQARQIARIYAVPPRLMTAQPRAAGRELHEEEE